MLRVSFKSIVLVGKANVFLVDLAEIGVRIRAAQAGGWISILYAEKYPQQQIHLY